MPHLHGLAVIAMLASCGRGAAPAREDARATASAPVPLLRFDRREERVGPAHWNVPGMAGVAFCPDGELVTTFANGWLARWNVSDGSLLSKTPITARDVATIAAQSALFDKWKSDLPIRVECGAEGKALVVGVLGSERGVKRGVLFQIDRDGARHLVPMTESVGDARFLPDGRIRLALSTLLDLYTWNGVTLEKVANPPSGLLSSSLLTNDGAFVIGTTLDTGALVWSVMFDEHTTTLPWGLEIRAAARAPDHALFALVSRGVVQMFPYADGTFGKPKRVAKIADEAVWLAASERYVVEAGPDHLWRITRPGFKRIQLSSPCQASYAEDHMAGISLSPDGHTLAVACTETGVRIVDLDAYERPPMGVSSVVVDLAWSHGGKLAAAQTAQVLVRDAAGAVTTIPAIHSNHVWWRGEQVAQLRAAVNGAIAVHDGEHWQNAGNLSFVPTQIAGSGNLVLAVNSSFGQAAILRDGVERPIALTRADVLQDTQLAIALDGSRAALLRGADSPSAVIMFDLAKGTSTEMPLSAQRVAITRDDLFLATPEGRLARAAPARPPPSGDPWGTAASTSDWTPIGQHDDVITSLAVSSTGVIAAGGGDGQISLWQGTKRLGTLDAHIGPVHALAWSADGHMLASGGDDGAIVWDLHP
jgi:WD40 repeat protein